MVEGAEGSHMRREEGWVGKALRIGGSVGILIWLAQVWGLCQEECMGCLASVGYLPVVALCHIEIRIACGSQPHQVL